MAEPVRNKAEAEVAGTAEGDTAAAEEEAKMKRKPRPRLTVQADVMQRLRAVAEEREMTASELAEELLNQFLDNVAEEEMAEAGTQTEERDAKGQIELRGSKAESESAS